MTDTSTPPTTKPLRPQIIIKLPDSRGLVAAGLFGLTWRIFEIIQGRPEITMNQGFMFLAQAVIVSGLIGGVVAFLFAASKSASDKLDKISDAVAPDQKGTPQ